MYVPRRDDLYRHVVWLRKLRSVAEEIPGEELVSMNALGTFGIMHTDLYRFNHGRRRTKK